MSEADGFEVPVHRSLTEPILFAGVPRKIAILNGTWTAALTLGAQSLIALPVGVAFHIVFALLTKIDPNFFDVLFSNLRRTKVWRVH
ncbi:MAG: VirB3 family type IV secretion system protein [Deltaproteobacteria bacterium]|nr:VirB3 family type IV secretion system protein [Deltaproteobacteria bacterium]